MSRNSKITKTVEVTGRDDYIILKALGYAITAIERLPERQQEWSDKEDMKAILRHFCTPGHYKYVVGGAEAHFDPEKLFVDLKDLPRKDNVIPFNRSLQSTEA